MPRSFHACAMKSAVTKIETPRLPGRAQALLALVVLASLLLVWQTRRIIIVHQQQRFDAEVLRIDSAIEQRMRSEEHTSELQSLMRISYAVFCLKKKIEYETNKGNQPSDSEG